MDAQQALADLTEISSQIETAVVFDESGKVVGSTLADTSGEQELARAASELLADAGAVKTGESSLTQLEVATEEGSVFVVRDGKTCIAATTGANPTVGLVFYDLKSVLRNVKPTPRKRATTATKKTAAAAKKPAARKAAPRKDKTDAS